MTGSRYGFPVTPGTGQVTDTDLTDDSPPRVVQAIGLRRSDDNTLLAPIDEKGVWAHVTPASTITDGTRSVPTAGTAVTLAASSTPVDEVTITARATNAGVIVVGGSTVVADPTSRRGLPLGAGDSLTVRVADLQDLYLDATVSGDGVTWMALA